MNHETFSFLLPVRPDGLRPHLPAHGGGALWQTLLAGGVAVKEFPDREGGYRVFSFLHISVALFPANPYICTEANDGRL